MFASMIMLAMCDILCLSMIRIELSSSPCCVCVTVHIMYDVMSFSDTGNDYIR